LTQPTEGLWASMLVEKFESSFVPRAHANVTRPSITKGSIDCGTRWILTLFFISTADVLIVVDDVREIHDRGRGQPEFPDSIRICEASGKTLWPSCECSNDGRLSIAGRLVAILNGATG